MFIKISHRDCIEIPFQHITHVKCSKFIVYMNYEALSRSQSDAQISIHFHSLVQLLFFLFNEIFNDIKIQIVMCEYPR